MEHLNDLVRAIRSRNPDFFWTLNSAGGFRSLFDPFCDEWQQSDLDTKIGIIDYLKNFVSFSELVRLWQNTEKRDYVLNDLPFALRKLQEKLPEAVEELARFQLKIYTDKMI